MEVIATKIPELIVLVPKVFGDSRGYFFESFNQQRFNEITQTHIQFVQDNQSQSKQHVLRGLHYQIREAQGKLIRVLKGAIYDVAVDIRRSSPTFGQWVGLELSDSNHKQFWIPKGFAHGFYVLSETAEIMYKTTDYYAPQHERTIAWNDPSLNIDWNLQATPILSDKDQKGLLLNDAELFA